ncbi:hypothetical protein [Neisseria bacilliformis]|uniref:hypothetical protein n=1 Tax=Neisseria bacilliformis TaxID=267212 RepID=UPI0028E3C528|nr:hypothetical protein [Neisseria bacilliformis]
MKLNARFNTFTLPRYREAVANHERYADFNPLALFRSILENDRLNEAEQLEVITLAKAAFPRFYEHLLLKDLHTYAALSRLGQEPLGEVQMRRYTAGLRREQGKRICQTQNPQRPRRRVHPQRLAGGRRRPDIHGPPQIHESPLRPRHPATHRQNRRSQTRDIRRLLDEENG